MVARVSSRCRAYLRYGLLLFPFYEIAVADKHDLIANFASRFAVIRLQAYVA